MDELTQPTTPAAKVKKTATIPVKDADFAVVSKSANEKWATETWLKLLWTNQAEFGTQQASFDVALNTRNASGTSRPQVTQALKLLDKKINESITYVKGYLLEKYKKEAAQSYYPSFGFEFKNKAHSFPKDQNKRSLALQLMIAAVDSNGFGAKEYGTTFWTGIKTNYDALLLQAKGTDSTVSSNVSDKNVLKATLKKTLNALVNCLKANYPDTYKAELRNWGLQKEKY